MICPSCNKFASQSADNEPEGDVEIDEIDQETGDVKVTGSVRIVVTSECCGDELKEANFDIEETIESIEAEEDCDCDLKDQETWSVDFESIEMTDETERTRTKTLKDGTVKEIPISPRYQKHFYGAEALIAITCACGKTKETHLWSDRVQAGSMDELN